jgi:hypothetical protein
MQVSLNPFGMAYSADFRSVNNTIRKFAAAGTSTVFANTGLSQVLRVKCSKPRARYLNAA